MHDMPIKQTIFDATRDKTFATARIAVDEFKIVATNNGFAVLKLNHADIDAGKFIPDPLAVAETVDSLVAQVRAWGEERFPPAPRPDTVTLGSRATNMSVTEGAQHAFDGSEMNSFGWALLVMKQGGRVSRKGWNGRDMWIAIQTSSVTSKMTLPYIYMRTAQGGYVPWLASQTDMLAADWHRV